MCRTLARCTHGRRRVWAAGGSCRLARWPLGLPRRIYGELSRRCCFWRSSLISTTVGGYPRGFDSLPTSSRPRRLPRCIRGGLAWFWIPIVAVGLAWLINLYNFMDGADGLAGGMTVFGFGSYAFAALAGPHPSVGLGWACAAIAGAAAGFLLLNFHPAKLFLGDAGSISLGLLAGAFGYWGWRHAVWPLWFPLVVFAPFIADASVTLLRRLLRREKFWEAHREHYYQRMVRLGVGHARTALCWYATMLVGAVVSLSVLACSTAVQWMTIAAWGSILFLLGVAIDVCWSRFQILTSK